MLQSSRGLQQVTCHASQLAAQAALTRCLLKAQALPTSVFQAAQRCLKLINKAQ